MGKRLDVNPGDKFNLLTLVKEGRKNKRGRRCFTCVCDCGNIVESVLLTHLISGNTKSCGCLHKQSSKQNGLNNRKYPKGSKKEYVVWYRMLRRCENPKDVYYKNYGGRGITVCDRWHDFSNFLIDIVRHPGKDFSFDRIDNNGNYEPTNWKFSTRKEQMNNTRANHPITAFGETKTMKRWSEDVRCVVCYTTLQYRINKGWEPEKAITQPARHKLKL